MLARLHSAASGLRPSGLSKAADLEPERLGAAAFAPLSRADPGSARRSAVFYAHYAPH